MPTLITLWLLMKVWEFLWENVGKYLIIGLRHLTASIWPSVAITEGIEPVLLQLLGVMLAVILVYIVGLFVGHFIGRTAWRLAELAVMRVPLLRAVYPAVKQVTDFLLADRSQHFQGSRVVAVEPHAKGIWSIGLVTGQGLQPLSAATRQQMLTVFIPSSPTAFSGYVLVVPRESVVELPLSVEQTMRLLVSGGVIAPEPKALEALRTSQLAAAQEVGVANVAG